MPGLRATSVRRTVIVAVALVTGQALLGAVIGFMTFDRDEDAPAPARAAEPAAAPPIVVPAPSTPAPTEASRPPRKRAAADVSSGTRRATPTDPAPAATVTRRPTTAASTQTSSAPATLPPSSAPAPAPPAPGLLPSPDTGQPGEETPVAREPCEEEGATGRTGDGKAVRCQRDRDGELRWRLV